MMYHNWKHENPKNFDYIVVDIKSCLSIIYPMMKNIIIQIGPVQRKSNQMS